MTNNNNNNGIKNAELNGSEKQIAWAEQIRAEQIHLLMDQITTGNVKDAKKGEYLGLVQALADVTAAKWWIDYRYRSLHGLMAAGLALAKAAK